MNKRHSSLDGCQLGFTFEPPSAASADADLAGIEQVIAAAVARALKDDLRSRGEIAGAMSALLSETVSVFMLDAYASEARGHHNISCGRFLALVAVTRRFDLLDAMIRKIGAAALVGEELLAARVGDLRARIKEARNELTALERQVVPIERTRDS